MWPSAGADVSIILYMLISRKRPKSRRSWASLLRLLPVAADVDIGKLAASLAGRPLSDSAFVVREAARIAARARLPALDQARLLQALAAAPDREGGTKQKFGFT